MICYTLNCLNTIVQTVSNCKPALLLKRFDSEYKIQQVKYPNHGQYDSSDRDPMHPT